MLCRCFFVAFSPVTVKMGKKEWKHNSVIRALEILIHSEACASAFPCDLASQIISLWPCSSP